MFRRLQQIKIPTRKPRKPSPLTLPLFPLFLLSLLPNLPKCQSPTISLLLPSGTYIAYQNNKLTQQFIQPQPTFSCSNTYRFTYNQTYQQLIDNTSYLLKIDTTSVNQEVFELSVVSLYGRIKPSQNVTSCLANCTVQIWNNCKNQKSFDAILVTVANVTSIFYNVICDSDLVFSPFQYGLIILVIFSILQIIITSKFQQANSFNNHGHYVNPISIAAYCLVLLIGQALILIELQITNLVVSYVCLALSIIFGVASVMVCYCEFAYWTNIKIFRIFIFSKWKIKIRIMDLIGLIMGFGVLSAWYFTNKNWIISDLVYTMIFIAAIKLIKFDSLKMATITFIFTASTNILFIVLTQTVRKVYFNDLILYIFNNPFFIMCPCINFTPNESCSWLFISCIAYPSILLSYLDRFDESRSSKIYFIVYVFALIACSSIWILISHFVSFTLPFDLINSPVCIILVCFFANRRGELDLLWNGEIFDAKHRNKSQQVHQLMDSLKEERSDSYKSQWFKLKYSEVSSASVQSSINNVRKSYQLNFISNSNPNPNPNPSSSQKTSKQNEDSSGI